MLTGTDKGTVRIYDAISDIFNHLNRSGDYMYHLLQN
jgi:hypothetical protein